MSYFLVNTLSSGVPAQEMEDLTLMSSLVRYADLENQFQTKVVSLSKHMEKEMETLLIT